MTIYTIPVSLKKKNPSHQKKKKNHKKKEIK